MNISVKITRQENADFFKVKINDIVKIDFEEYVAAVVASEIGNSNIEACKAQAIAARSYAQYRGVLNGKIISDSSSTDQAYRAIRYNEEEYPNCIKAAKLTAGIVVYYNGKIAETVYSSSNGGHLVSCEQKWGNKVPYLIEKEDPWTLAVTNIKNGHGVGMSQKGAIWAGTNNYSFKDILQFYYPNTELRTNYGLDILNKIKVIQISKEEIKKIQSELFNLQIELNNILKKIEGL